MKDQKDYLDEITDFEIRVIHGINSPLSEERSESQSDYQSESQSTNIMIEAKEDSREKKKPSHFKWWIVLIATAIIAAIAFATGMSFAPDKDYDEVQNTPEMPDSYETVAMDSVEVLADEPAFCHERTDTVNDILLHIITPEGCLPELHLGSLPMEDKSIILAVQAADVRADNGDISGAYVFKGELMSKGVAKLGFCAIIGKELTLGRQKETPLFQRAIEENGYFFRQYSLVSQGTMIDIKPKGKAVRRALCLLDGKLSIIESMDRESYHDFSQALADLGVEEALALVGGEALLYYVDEQEEAKTIGTSTDKKYENVNFIVWRK